MRVVELHPEELIDREARGAIGPDDAVRLEAHCARCVACRYERTMRAHFADVLREEPEVVTRRADCAERDPWWNVRWLRFGVGAAVVLACAAHLLGPDDELLAASRAARTVTSERTSRSSRDAGRDRSGVVTPAKISSAPRAATAAMLFDTANRARVRGDYARALVAYRRLQQRFPASREARVSFVAMGRMQLDRADAAGALASFERYETNGNPDLDAVVMAGRALALDELGSETSSVAWGALLARHPETPYAQHARLRVAARSLQL